MNALRRFPKPHLHIGICTVAMWLATATAPALAQQTDHSQHAPPAPTEPDEDPHAGHTMPPERTSPAPKPHTVPVPVPEEPTIDRAAMGHTAPPREEAAGDAEDHSGHAMPAQQTREPSPIDDSRMRHEPPREQAAEPVDHEAMGHQVLPAAQADEHVEHATDDADLAPNAAPHDPIPPVTPADRAAAFPDVDGHAVHDTSIHWFALVNRFETWDADHGDSLEWEGTGWIGTDLDRAWLRSEGEYSDGGIESADIEIFYGRAIARWWDAVVGIRHDFGDDPSQTFAAVGVIGLAPYMLEVEATAYLGQGGQTGVRAEAEYETLFTNRLILQWLAEAELYGKDDPTRGIGSGLGSVEAGLRLRYEFDRQFAPYIGVVHERAYGGTAEFARSRGEPVEDTRLVLGVRVWF